MKRAANWAAPVFKVVGFVEVRSKTTGDLINSDSVKLFVVAGTLAEAISVCDKYLEDLYVYGMAEWAFRSKLRAVRGTADQRWVIVQGGI